MNLRCNGESIPVKRAEKDWEKLVSEFVKLKQIHPLKATTISRALKWIIET